MAYKYILAGEESDEIFETYKDAEEDALYASSCMALGAEIQGMMGDWEDDEMCDPEDSDYEIFEVDENGNPL